MTGVAFQTFDGATWVQNPQWAAQPGLLHGTLARAGGPDDLTGKLPLDRLVPEVTPALRALAEFAEETLIESSREVMFRVESARAGAFNLVAADQVHGDEIGLIQGAADLAGAREVHPGESPWVHVHEFPATDGLISLRQREVLVIQTADCLPILLWDPVHRVAGACHCGWKGVLARLAAKMAERMIGLGASPRTLQAWIGPGICGENYEVGGDLAAKFRAAFGAEVVSPDGLRLDLAAAAAVQLHEAGLEYRQIGQSGACTFGEPELYHSYRRDAARSGRIITVIGLL